MLASAALGVAGGSRLSPADPEDAIDVHSVPGNPNKALHMPAPSTFADSDASSNKSIGSRRFASVQNTGAKTLQRAEDGSAIGSSQHARNDSSSILSAEQLWEGAWKAFEEPVPGQGLPDTESPQIALARAQQLDSQHRSSFPSLAARFFRQGHPSGAQNRRQAMSPVNCALPSLPEVLLSISCEYTTVSCLQPWLHHWIYHSTLHACDHMTEW